MLTVDIYFILSIYLHSIMISSQFYYCASIHAYSICFEPFKWYIYAICLNIYACVFVYLSVSFSLSFLLTISRYLLYSLLNCFYSYFILRRLFPYLIIFGRDACYCANLYTQYLVISPSICFSLTS